MWFRPCLTRSRAASENRSCCTPGGVCHWIEVIHECGLRSRICSRRRPQDPLRGYSTDLDQHECLLNVIVFGRRVFAHESCNAAPPTKLYPTSESWESEVGPRRRTGILHPRKTTTLSSTWTWFLGKPDNPICSHEESDVFC
jgi:hypothetical protein